MKSIRIYLLIIAVLTISCNKEDADPKYDITDPLLVSTDTLKIDENLVVPTISYGIYGYVLRWKGNFMPGPVVSGTIDSVSNVIYIYKLLTIDSIKNAGIKNEIQFYYLDSIKQKPVKIIYPNRHGFYQVKLNHGDYTGLIKLNNGKLYINRFGSQGQVNPISIDTGKLLHRNFDIEFEKNAKK